MPDRELEGRVALVTGGSRGIGAAVCAELGAAGADVVVNYASAADRADQVCADVRSRGGIAHAIAGDVSTPEGAAGLVAQVESEVGPIAILVCNAGITRDNLIMKLSDDDWRSVIDTNLGGAFFTCRAVARPMLKRRAGDDRDHELGGRRARERRPDQLRRLQGRAHRSHQIARKGARRSWHPRERRRAGVHLDAADRRPARAGAGGNSRPRRHSGGWESRPTWPGPCGFWCRMPRPS